MDYAQFLEWIRHLVADQDEREEILHLIQTGELTHAAEALADILESVIQRKVGPWAHIAKADVALNEAIMHGHFNDDENVVRSLIATRDAISRALDSFEVSETEDTKCQR